jgi:hypothetical protein
MAAGPTQRVGDNASTLETCEYSRRNSGGFVKGATVLRIFLSFCISIAVIAIAWAEPSATPSHVVSRIPRQSVQSSAIAKIGYSKRRHMLEIEFVSGAVYRYSDVPVAIYRGLMSSESKARFYDSNVRGHYRSVLVRSQQKEPASTKSTE